MPKPRKRRNGPTPPRQIRVRQISSTEQMMFSRGMRIIANRRCIDRNALREILRLATNQELMEGIAAKNADECFRLLDKLVVRCPNDARWDEYRSYRNAMMRHAN